MDKASTGRRDLDIHLHGVAIVPRLYSPPRHGCIHHRDTEGTEVFRGFYVHFYSIRLWFGYMHHRDTEGTEVFRGFYVHFYLIRLWFGYVHHCDTSVFTTETQRAQRFSGSIYVNFTRHDCGLGVFTTATQRGLSFHPLCVSVVIINQLSFVGDYRSRTTRKPAASATIMATSTARCGAISFRVAPRWTIAITGSTM